MQGCQLLAAFVFTERQNTLTDCLAASADYNKTATCAESIFAISLLRVKFNQMKKYFSERNALTVMVSVFCFIMMLLAFFKEQSIWQGIAFALAFSFSVEVICHRAKENRYK